MKSLFPGCLPKSSLLAWFLLSLGLSIPMLGYVIEMMGGAEGGVALSLAAPVNIRMTIAAQGLLIPFALLQLRYAFKEPRRELVFLQISILFGLALVLCVELPDFNQYKLHYPLAILMAFSALTALARWRKSDHPGRRLVSRAFSALLLTLALLNCFFGQLLQFERSVTTYVKAPFDGVNVEWHGDYGGRVNTFYWIRDNTRHDAVVIQPIRFSESSLYSGRLNYVRRRQYFYIPDAAAYEARKDNLDIFFDPGTSIERYQALVAFIESELPGRPLYAIVLDAELSPALMASRGAALVFADTVHPAKVYRLNPPAGE